MTRTTPASARLLMLLPLTLVGLSGGCAKSTITLALDLYKDNPTVATPVTQDQLSAYLKNLGIITQEAAQLAEDRKSLARQLYDLNQALLDLATKARTGNAAADPGAAATGLSFLQEYERAVDAKAAEVQRRADDARAAVNAYSLQLDKPAAPTGGKGQGAQLKGQATVSLADVNQKLQRAAESAWELGQSLGTDFEKWLPAQWPAIRISASEANLGRWLTPQRAELVKEDFAKIRKQADALAATLDAQAARGRRIGDQARQTLRAAPTQQEVTPGQMQKAVERIADAATRVPASLGLGDRGAAALGDLITSTDLLFSQIDRLQDPADPAWRVVAAPENEDKWSVQFPRTSFYAEGNSSAVVVRDTPISFRVQSGRNNPAALVKGQLEISRAVANAAITVAGAASGIPLPSLPGGAGATAPAASTDGTTPPAATTSEDPQELARRRATVERQAELRRQALRSLSRTLADLRDELNRLTPNDDTTAERRKSILGRLQSTLQAHQALFKEVAATGAAGTTTNP